MTYQEAGKVVSTFVSDAEASAPSQEFRASYALGKLQSQATEWLWELEYLKKKKNEAEMHQLHDRLAGKKL